MNFGYREVCLDHDTGPRHPESADRLRAIRRGLAEYHGVEYVAAGDADEELICKVHDPDYVEEIKTFCQEGGGNWDADTVAVEDTWKAALASAGLAEWAALSALDGDDGRETPFALGRPPGHHAVADDAMGFCFVDNAVVAAQSALDDGADGVAIFDWDVHHGNGTQDICYDRDDIFYASIHEDGLYPGTGEVDETGTGDGAMTTLNVPYDPGADTVDYLAAVDELIAPEIESFDPDLLLVSAGFDAHRHDPISRMRVSSEGYGLLTQRMRDLADRCDAGLGFVLEGGYSLDTLTDSLTTVHEVFDGYQPSQPDGSVSEDARDVLDALVDQGFGST
ncbi:histone deacetylase family protein [Halomicrobium katesii]|uniref:histone deacetylase family protein n=1 Tax=Halomicrobium katesii TaxID=437163 RepID=UPI0003820734|nr:histone deacetylase [Halomicrobium katesii]